MEIGNVVKISKSNELEDMKLSELAEREGEIVEIIRSTGNRIIGCWVKLENSFEDESEWFIPVASITISKQ